MKRLLIATSMLAALMITIGAFAAHTKADAKTDERATIEFTQTVKLLDVFLKGKYLVVTRRRADGEGRGLYLCIRQGGQTDRVVSLYAGGTLEKQIISGQ